ncbi:HEAT repeat domain-containing protein [Egbenema bharatensis]|uniref:HEAT repeat domain-containing protein n=1 Tax=Egbenema bharatensis TaxID=3463334 RepID=UPI003A83F1EA
MPQAEAAVPVLFQMLHDQNFDVLQSVAEALRKIGTEAAIVALAQVSTTESIDTKEFEPING